MPNQLERVPIGWNHPIDKNTLRFKMLEHFRAQTGHSFAENALGFPCKNLRFICGQASIERLEMPNAVTF
jgi:hypothetical protein